LPYRVEHAGVRQRLGEGVVVVTDDVEVDDEARAFVGTGLQEFTDALGHVARSPLSMATVGRFA
jgi:hypothetical protein